MEVDLGRMVSVSELLMALERTAKHSGGTLETFEGSIGGKKVVVLGSAREELRGQVATFYPRVAIPFGDYRDRFFQATHIVLSFEDEKPHFDEGWYLRYPSRRFLEGRNYRMIRMNVSLAGKKTGFAKTLSRSLVFVPVIGWLALVFLSIGPFFNEERYGNSYSSTEGFSFIGRLREDIKSVYMQYLGQVGDILKSSANPATA